MSDFVHLHLHSQYSLLDGAIKMKDVVERSHKLGMKAVAVTDHGNMYGTVDFYKRAKAAGIKPIIGCEAYVASGKGMHDRTERKAYHLILLAKNSEGYANLKKLVSTSFLEGFYYHPRIDKELLRNHSKGLYALSACLGGEIAQKYMHEGPDAAREAAIQYRDIFEPGHFHLEVQDNKYPEQYKVNDFYKQLGKDLGIPLCATNDAHYLERKDAKAHEILMCIQHGRKLSDEGRMRHATDELFLKGPQDIWASDTFKDIPEAIENTIKIADNIDLELELGKVFLPNFKVPEGLTREEYLAQVAKAGLERRKKEARYPMDLDKYMPRLEYELGVINKMGFAGYFLIVWDFIKYAKQHGVPVGPGRGSGAGSLVAYSLRITDLDPLPYDLLFERFLNPERISMPDFDIDFCQDRRGEVIDYVTNKYGAPNVGQIVTFSQLSAKSVIKDVARVMDIPYQDVNEITKLIPNLVDGKKVSIEKAMELEPKLKQIQNEKPVFKEILDLARQLEGLNRGTGIHAAGVVIGDLPLESYVPLCRGIEKVKDPVTGKDVEKIFRITQFAKDEVEMAGLVKFDFLGLKTLTVIDKAINLVNRRIADENKGVRKKTEHPHVPFVAATADGSTPDIDLSVLPFGDANVFALCSRGDTDGVFQMESSGFKELLKRLKPDRFEDIIAAGALYRPGPLDAGLVDDYIERKHGRKPTTYLHACLEPILKPTYGVIVYQEQVMLIAVHLCGLSMGQSDTLRKAMGKKNPEVMAKMRKSFVDGAVEKSGIKREVADEYFTLIEKFAGYAFNKSHSAAYAVLTYQTAFLKNYYPVEFMAALLSTEMNSTDNIVKYTAEARDMKIAVLPPDVNQSERGFSSPEGKIRFGLGAIKGIGTGCIEAIVKAREKKPFSDMFDFCERVEHGYINKKALEALVESGAMDGFGVLRARMFGAIEKALSTGASTQKDAKIGQSSLFALLAPKPQNAADAAKQNANRYPPIDEWDTKDKLKREKAALGFFLSGHPLDRYRDDLKRMVSCTTQGLMQKGMRAEVSLAGVIVSMRERPLKDGSGRMAFLQLEDLYGTCEVLVFSKTYADCEQVLRADEPILVRGSVTIEGDEESQIAKVRAEKIVLLANARNERTQRIDLTLPTRLVDEARLNRLKGVIGQHKGNTPTRVILTLENGIQTQIDLPFDLGVTVSEDLAVHIERIFEGERVVAFV